MATYESYKGGDFLDFTKEEDLEDEGNGLCIPDDPIEDLEWFPNFIDGSISLTDILIGLESETLSLSGFPNTQEQETEESNNRVTLRKGFDGHLRQLITSKKPRSKRVVGRAWSSMKVSLLLSSTESAVLMPEKGGVVLGRRCTHCDTDNTPQWRMGPMGPKTLCNGCGLRYKSGRLVLQYRPAVSPSFNNGEHSKSHKKIRKMKGPRYPGGICLYY